MVRLWWCALGDYYWLFAVEFVFGFGIGLRMLLKDRVCLPLRSEMIVWWIKLFWLFWAKSALPIR